MNRTVNDVNLAEKKNRDIQELDYLYSLVKDEKSRRENDIIAKQEEYARKLPIDYNETDSGIIKEVRSKPTQEEWYDFTVLPEGENRKSVLVIPKRNYEYVTQLGINAYLNEYEIIKTIGGMEMHFVTTTNTSFSEVKRLVHLDRELTKEEKEYLRLFYNQMSDIHLRTCKAKFSGYIGTVERNSKLPSFDMDYEDYAATKVIRQRDKGENER